MPLNYLRRPLFLAVAAYALALSGLHGIGFFDVSPPEGLARLRYRSSLAVEGRVISPLKKNHKGEWVFVLSSRMAGVAARQKLQVYLPKEGPDNQSLRPGQPVLLEGLVRVPRRPRNPGEFDERRFLSDRGVSWIMRAAVVRVQSAAVPRDWKLWAWAETVRRSMETCFERFLSPTAARLLTGLTLGYKGPLPGDLNRAVQDAGVMHLLVPSGAKVAFVMMWCLGVSLGLGLGVKGRWAAATFVGGFYTLMVGGDAPYARAYLAAVALFLCRGLERESGTFQALVLSAAAILLWEPRELFTAGFQMTYLAVGGLVLAMPAVSRAIPRRWPRPARGMMQIMAVSLIVQVMLWPVFAQVFGRGSVIGVLANIILVPASGILMAAGFLLWGLDIIGQDAAGLWAPCVERMMALFAGVCRGAASLPHAAVELSPMSRPGILAFYLAAFSALVLPRRRAALGLLLGAACAAGAGLAWGSRPLLRAVILSLPSGRACVVLFPDGKRWLIDAGGPGGAIVKALKHKGVRRLDRVIVTGPEPGRWRGVSRVLKDIPVGQLWFPRRLADRKRAAQVLAAAAARGVKVERRDLPGSLAICRGIVCFEFGPGRAPRVRRLDAEYSIIPSRLKKGAVEVITDGEKAQITGALGQKIH